jgi:hypothetical protein
VITDDTFVDSGISGTFHVDEKILIMEITLKIILTDEKKGVLVYRFTMVADDLMFGAIYLKFMGFPLKLNVNSLNWTLYAYLDEIKRIFLNLSELTEFAFLTVTGNIIDFPFQRPVFDTSHNLHKFNSTSR